MEGVFVMAEKIILVAAGGAAGAVCRYLLSLIPVRGEFPLMTFLTNLLGAFLIGLVVGLSVKQLAGKPGIVLLLKTGFCGGFTTFSTFSLEAFQLFEKGRIFTGGVYVTASILTCIIGTGLGLFAAAVIGADGNG